MKTLLTGKPYVKACDTDVAKTFKRVRKELKEAKDKGLDKIIHIRVARKA